MKTEPTGSRAYRIGIDLIFLLAFAAAALILYRKTHYGIASNDEASYLSLALRLLQGDSLIVNEWHPSQLFSVLMVLPMKIFTVLKEGTEGMVLWFRLLYTLSQCVMAISIYLVLRRQTALGAAAGALMFMIFAPNGIMALSYITLGIDLMLLSLLVLFSCTRGRKLWCFAAGLLFAGAVICCPYLVLGYLLYLIVLAVKRLIGRASPHGEREMLAITCACASAAASFFAFLLSRASLGEILTALPYAVVDPVHPPLSLGKALSYLTELFCIDGAPGIYLSLGILAALCLNRKLRRGHGSLLFSAAAISCFILLTKSAGYINYLIWPVNILALFPMLLGPDESMRRIFRYIWLPGMLYTFCLHLGSNQGYYAICFGSMVPAVGSVAIVARYAERLAASGQWKRALPPCLLSGVFGLFLLFCLAYLRFDFIYPTSSVEKQTEYISYGINAGLSTTPEMAGGYYVIMEDMDAIREKGVVKVLMYTSRTWYYLTYEGFENCGYSAWLAVHNDGDSAYEKTMAYLELCPEKIPQAVFIDSIHYDQRLVDHFQGELGYVREELNSGTLLYKAS